MYPAPLSPAWSLQDYVRRIQWRLRARTASRGIGLTVGVAVALTVLCVATANEFAFSDGSVIGGRTILFGAIIAVIILALWRPLRGLGIKNAAGHAEREIPAFDGRIETFVDQSQGANGAAENPMLDLLAEDTLQVAEAAPAESVVGWQRIITFAALAATGFFALLWLGTSGPGYWSYGTSRLWAGWLEPNESPYYELRIEPGDATVRRGADLTMTAEVVGFESPSAQVYVKYADSVKWEEAPMRRQLDGTGFEFLFAGVRDPFSYYVSAGGIRSEEFAVDVVSMPVVRGFKLTYHYPKWTGLKNVVEDPGGDINAVAGTEVEIEVETDKPLEDGVILVDGEQAARMESAGLTSVGRITVKGDGLYNVAELYKGEEVRISDEFFITVIPDRKPTLEIGRPGHDFQATNIEEVVVEMKAEDDFGIASLDLFYSLNGGELKKVGVKRRGFKEARGQHTFYLEEMGEGKASLEVRSEDGEEQELKFAHLVPGDLITYYAVARDHKLAAKTDMYFVEVRPFDVVFRQGQQGGGGMGGGEQRQNEISKRQKEIIAATWNLIRTLEEAKPSDRSEIHDNALVLSDIQLTLRDQGRTLVERTKARQLTGADEKIGWFIENLEKAAEYMEPAADKLHEMKLTEALAPEQKALQYVLRAEAIFRELQISFGRGNGQGGGQAQLDLAEMFELEMDLTKNQYETGGGSSQQQLEREVDELMEKLRALAQRQQKLAERRKQQQEMTFAQRWQQEMLRREALELKRKLEELQRRQREQQAMQARSGNRSQQQTGQSQSGQHQSDRQSEQRSSRAAGRSRSAGGAASPQNLQQIIERLDQATRDMQTNPSSTDGSQQRAGNDPAAAQRAQERLQEALQQLTRERRGQSASALSELAQRSETLARDQREIGNRLKQDLRDSIKAQQKAEAESGRRGRLRSHLSPTEALDLVDRKKAMQEELEAIEREMQGTIRRLDDSQREASRKLREALGEIQQNEIGTRLRVVAEYIRRGLAPHAAQGEDMVTRSLEQLRDSLKEAERLAQANGPGSERGLERSLAQLENMRRRLERASDGDQRGEQQGSQGQPGTQPGGQQGTQSANARQGQSQQGASTQTAQGGRLGGPQRSIGGASNYGGMRRPGSPGGIGLWDEQARREMEQALREGVRPVPRLTRDLQTSGIYREDLEEIRRFVKGLPNSRFAGNPELLAQEYRRLLSLLEQLELQVRRKVEEEQGSQVRTSVSEPVPEEYREAVAEYFRRLSRGR